MEFNYTTKLEDGDVIVFWSYDADECGIYDSRIDKVIFNGIDVISILSEDVLNILDCEATQEFEDYLKDAS